MYIVEGSRPIICFFVGGTMDVTTNYYANCGFVLLLRSGCWKEVVNARVDCLQ